MPPLFHERVQQDARQLGGEEDRRGLLAGDSQHGVTLAPASVDDRAGMRNGGPRRMSRPSTRHRPLARAMIGQVSTRLTLALAATILLLAAFPAAGMAACANPVACENEKAGSAPSAWQVSGAGDSTIQGYATSMSVNKGGTIRFKVKTTASNYHIDIYRLGYYQGNGARLQQAGIRPTASLPQTQPACLTDCGDGPDRLRELGRVGVVDRPVRPRCPASTSRAWCATTTAARARSRSSSATTRRIGHAGQDVRRDVAGLQQVRRQQPVLVHLAVPAGQPRRLQGRVLGLLQPARSTARSRRTTGARTCSTPSTR